MTPYYISFVTVRLRRQFLDDFSSKLMRLQTASGQRVIQSRRFTAILGLCLAAKTVMDVSETLLEQGFQYVLSYNMSQDHLELLFGRIRRMGGYNNNPNVVQLQHAMRRLTLHNFISPSATDNSVQCEDGDDLADCGLLQIRRPPQQKAVAPDGEPMPAVIRHILVTEAEGSAFLYNCVGYMAGYVCKTLIGPRIRCGACTEALLSNEEDALTDDVTHLISVRDNGGLLVPSASTYAVVASAERHLGALRKCGNVVRENLSLRIQCSVLAHFMTERTHELFPGHQEHMFALRADECHAVTLVKMIVARYLSVRLHAHGRSATLSGLAQTHIRHSLHKQVLFAHQ